MCFAHFPFTSYVLLQDLYQNTNSSSVLSFCKVAALKESDTLFEEKQKMLNLKMKSPFLKRIFNQNASSASVLTSLWLADKF